MKLGMLAFDAATIMLLVSLFAAVRSPVARC